jgi:hypothetical protein
MVSCLKVQRFKGSRVQGFRDGTLGCWRFEVGGCKL